MLKIAFGSVPVCWWWLSNSGVLCPSLLLGCSSSFLAAGRFPLVETACSCSPGTRPPVCCRALLHSAPKDCLKPKLNIPKTKNPKSTRKKPPPWYSCFLSAFLSKVSSILGREGSFSCRIYENKPSHCIKQNSEGFFHQ